MEDLTAAPIDLANLQTEGRNPLTADIDLLPTLDLVRVINDEDHGVAPAVALALPAIAAAIDALAPRVAAGGRVVYIGAGTSGRLGILDASELPPTFRAPADQFLSLIAGGDAAIRVAQEGAEDDPSAAVRDLSSIVPPLGRGDAIIGIAASGRTPYVLAGLQHAKTQWGCLTIGVSCVSPSAMSHRDIGLDVSIEVVTGPEVVTGSTRLKAGTATKMVLNMLSTGTMIRVGKTYGNLMVDLMPTNKKLRQRSRMLLRTVVPQVCGQMSDDNLDDLLNAAGGSVKVAAVMAQRGVSVDEARGLLQSNGGVLKKVLADAKRDQVNGHHTRVFTKEGEARIALCVDAGGSKTAVAVADVLTGEEVARSEIRKGCNMTSTPIEEVIKTISSAIATALRAFQEISNGSTATIVIIWLAIAGIDRPGLRDRLHKEVMASRDLFPDVDPLRTKLRLSNDLEILAATAMFTETSGHGHKVSSSNAKSTKPRIAVVAVAGTGSVAMEYQVSWTPRYTNGTSGTGETSNGNHTNGIKKDLHIVRTARVGGWGPVLGDDGAGHWLGVQGIRRVLGQMERQQFQGRREGHPLPKLEYQPSLLQVSLLEYLAPETGGGRTRAVEASADVLSLVLGDGNSGSQARVRIAGAARCVLDAAGHGDEEALDIVNEGARLVADLAAELVGSGDGGLGEAERQLVLGGGLMKDRIYRDAVMRELERRQVRAEHVTVVNDAVGEGARIAARLAAADTVS